MTRSGSVTFLAVMVWGTASSGLCGWNEERIRFDLGGLRQVRAILSILPDEYRVAVRMLPVRSFDSATNGQLNREKARWYALQALAKHLSDKRKVQLVVRGAEVIDTGNEAKFYTLTLQVPKGGVRLEP